MSNITRVQSDLVNKVDAARISLDEQYNTALEKQRNEFKEMKDKLVSVQQEKLNPDYSPTPKIDYRERL